MMLRDTIDRRAGSRASVVQQQQPPTAQPSRSFTPHVFSRVSVRIVPSHCTLHRICSKNVAAILCSRRRHLPGSHDSVGHLLAEPEGNSAPARLPPPPQAILGLPCPSDVHDGFRDLLAKSGGAPGWRWRGGGAVAPHRISRGDQGHRPEASRLCGVRLASKV